jgi:predicted amidohydrolase
VGASVIVNPDGYPVAGPAGDEETVTLLARCELAHAREKRISEHNHVLADRRPELYGRVVSGS